MNDNNIAETDENIEMNTEHLETAVDSSPGITEQEKKEEIMETEAPEAAEDVEQALPAAEDLTEDPQPSDNSEVAILMFWVFEFNVFD